MSDTSNAGSALSGAVSGASTGATIGSVVPGVGTAVGAVVGGAIGLVGGLLGGIGASKARKQATKQANKIAREDLAFRKQVYGEEQRLYGPLKQRLVGEAMSSEPLDYAQISGRIRENYANALRRINETSGIGAARSQGARLKMATELAGAYGQGLTNRRNLGLAVSGRDQTIPLAMNVSGGYQNIQRMAENEAAIQGQQAAANWGAAASGLGQLIYGASGLMNKPDDGLASNPWGDKKIIYYPDEDIPVNAPTYGGGLDVVTINPGLTGGGYAGLPKLG